MSRPVPTHRRPLCPRCGVRWRQVADATGHCAGCHRTFSSLEAFDRHQTHDGGLVCHDPATLLNRRGEPVWETFTDPEGAQVWRRLDGRRDPRPQGAEGVVPGPRQAPEHEPSTAPASACPATVSTYPEGASL